MGDSINQLTSVNAYTFIQIHIFCRVLKIGAIVFLRIVLIDKNPCRYVPRGSFWKVQDSLSTLHVSLTLCYKIRVYRYTITWYNENIIWSV